MKIQSEKNIKKRNFYISDFFKKNGINITIMGNINSPLIVTKDNIVLSCFPKNFDLEFKENGFNSETLFIVKLRQKTILIKEKLINWIKTAKHRKVYLFQYNNMYFSKYEIREKKIPLYVKNKELAYYVFKRQKALEIIEKLKKYDIEVTIVY